MSMLRSALGQVRRAMSRLLANVLVLTLLAGIILPVSPVQAAPWWDAAWLNKISISFNATTLTENLTNFVVTVFLTPDRVDFADIAVNGTDLRFIDQDSNTVLPYHITQWSDTPGSENGTIIVQIPQIDAGSDYSDVFFMYYNNAAAADAQDKNAVWAGTGAVAVYPFYSNTLSSNVTGASVFNSVSVNHTLTSTNTTWSTQGRIFGGGINSYLQGSTINATGFAAGLTLVEWWERAGPSGDGVNHNIISGLGGTSSSRLGNYIDSGGTRVDTIATFTGGATTATSIGVLAAADWNMTGSSWNTTDLSNIANGVLVNPTATVGTFVTGAVPTRIGQKNTASPTWVANGTIGEMRVFTRALSAQELLYYYRSEQYAYDLGDGGFLYYGDTEPEPSVTAIAASGISMDRDGVTAATVSGNITSLGSDPNGGDFWFEYGLTVAYGATTANDTFAATGVVNAALPNNLTPGATYNYRLVAQNEQGTVNGTNLSFAFTMPTIVTGTAAAAGSTITLNGDITDAGVATDSYVYFDYGPTVAYGSATTETPLAGVAPFSDIPTTPSSDTTLFYRPAVRNGAVISYGAGASIAVPSAVGSSILRSLLRVFLAAVILIGITRIGAAGGGVAMLVSAVVGVVAFVIVDTFITTLF